MQRNHDILASDISAHIVCNGQNFLRINVKRQSQAILHTWKWNNCVFPILVLDLDEIQGSTRLIRN